MSTRGDDGEIVNGVKIGTGESRTRSEFARDLDVNVMMRRAMTGMGVNSRKMSAAAVEKVIRDAFAGGYLPAGGRQPLGWFDVTGFGDYMDAKNRVIAAEAVFMNFSASDRARFRNQPGLFLEFAKDDKNRDEVFRMIHGEQALAAFKAKEARKAADAAKAAKEASEASGGGSKGTGAPDSAQSGT